VESCNCFYRESESVYPEPVTYHLRTLSSHRRGKLCYFPHLSGIDVVTGTRKPENDQEARKIFPRKWTKHDLRQSTLLGGVEKRVLWSNPPGDGSLPDGNRISTLRPPLRWWFSLARRFFLQKLACDLEKRRSDSRQGGKGGTIIVMKHFLSGGVIRS